MYPNPATKYLYIRGVDLSRQGTNFKLFDAMGKEVILRPDFTRDGSVFNIDDLTAGIHYLVVHRELADAIVLKFVVQKSN